MGAVFLLCLTPIFPCRYTLTEGDFHHLKNARLSHLPLPPSATLKIVTIHECESNENSIALTPRHPPSKPSLAIFQVSLHPPWVLGSKRDPGLRVGAGAVSGYVLLLPGLRLSFVASTSVLLQDLLQVLREGGFSPLH